MTTCTLTTLVRGLQSSNWSRQVPNCTDGDDKMLAKGPNKKAQVRTFGNSEWLLLFITRNPNLVI